MKSYLVRSLLLFLLLGTGGWMTYAQELDSLKRKALSVKLDEYFAAIEGEGTDVQKGEADFLIESGSDSLVRQFIALKIYDHYLNSPVMGSEAVAVHVFDRWFSSGKLKMKNDIDFINAQVYADFNRQSLVGLPAPQLSMQDIDGQEVSFFGNEGPSVDSEDTRRYSVLYFYDTDCSKCKVETILLRNILEDNNFPINLLAVYSGDDREAWERYVGAQFEVEASNTQLFHLWDPDYDSDFQRKYGVLQTPRLYLVRPDGIIVGRGLDVESLYVMLKRIFSDVPLSYGGTQSEKLFDGIFASDTGELNPSAERVSELADYITETTLPKGDTLMFRQLSGDLLYYLASHNGEGFKGGLAYLIKNNISSRPKVWDSADDSLKVVGFAEIMGDLLSKATIGSRLPDLKLPGELRQSSKMKTGRFKVGKLKGKTNIIMFYTEGCQICKAEKEALSEMLSTDSDLKVLYVNVDAIVASDSALADKMFDSFDLTSLPYIIQTDRKGKVLRRYLSFRK